MFLIWESCSEVTITYHKSLLSMYSYAKQNAQAGSTYYLYTNGKISRKAETKKKLITIPLHIHLDSYYRKIDK